MGHQQRIEMVSPGYASHSEATVHLLPGLPCIVAFLLAGRRRAAPRACSRLHMPPHADRFATSRDDSG